MKVKAVWEGRRTFRAMGPSGYEITMDAKPEYGGEGRGNSPLELLLIGLAGCMGITVTNILEKKRMHLDEFDLEASGTRNESYPQSFTEIELIFRIKGDLDAEKLWQVILASEQKYCSVSASLKAKIVPKLILNGEEVSLPEA